MTMAHDNTSLIRDLMELIYEKHPDLRRMPLLRGDVPISLEKQVEGLLQIVDDWATRHDQTVKSYMAWTRAVLELASFTVHSVDDVRPEQLRKQIEAFGKPAFLQAVERLVQKHLALTQELHCASVAANWAANMTIMAQRWPGLNQAIANAIDGHCGLEGLQTWQSLRESSSAWMLGYMTDRKEQERE